MRTSVFTAVLLFTAPLFTAPLLAADAMPAAPATPMAINYEVWGYRWNGRQYVRQPNYNYSTTDIQQAANYANDIDSFAGWRATTNIPPRDVFPTAFGRVRFGRPGGLPAPAVPTYAVWAYKLTDGKWVKNAQYSWTTGDPAAGVAYAQKVSAVPGWSATTNSPASVPVVQSVAGGRIVHGARGDYIHVPTISIGGWTIRVPNVRVPAGVQVSEATDSNSFDYGPNYGDTSQIDQMNALQDQLNQQQMNNNLQDSLNEQNFENTENMINPQNMIDAQNAAANAAIGQ